MSEGDVRGVRVKSRGEHGEEYREISAALLTDKKAGYDKLNRIHRGK